MLFESIGQIRGYGFQGATPTPCAPESDTLAEALGGLIETRRLLAAKRVAIPGFTGQWSEEDYYANELEAYYRAADFFAAAVRSVRMEH